MRLQHPLLCALFAVTAATGAPAQDNAAAEENVQLKQRLEIAARRVAEMEARTALLEAKVGALKKKFAEITRDPFDREVPVAPPRELPHEPPATNLPLRLALELSDGSCVIGTPTIEAIPVNTSYAEMKIPVDRVQSVTFGNDGDGAALELRNGDRLKGEVTLQSIELDALFGRIAIESKHLACINVLAAGEPHIKVGFAPGPTGNMQARLQKIIIPELDFRAANIYDVADWFQHVSREQEPADPEHPRAPRGINVLVDVKGADIPLITFSARQIAMAEALKIVTEVAGLAQTTMGNTVILRPKPPR